MTYRLRPPLRTGLTMTTLTPRLAATYVADTLKGIGIAGPERVGLLSRARLVSVVSLERFEKIN